MKRWTRGRLLAQVIPTSWAILPTLHIGQVQGVRSRRPVLTVGWLCAQLSVTL